MSTPLTSKICHPDRSGPIFSSVPNCGASGRGVEGSLFLFRGSELQLRHKPSPKTNPSKFFPPAPPFAYVVADLQVGSFSGSLVVAGLPTARRRRETGSWVSLFFLPSVIPNKVRDPSASLGGRSFSSDIKLLTKINIPQNPSVPATRGPCDSLLLAGYSGKSREEGGKKKQGLPPHDEGLGTQGLLHLFRTGDPN